jgi:hypothetical protein
MTNHYDPNQPRDEDGKWTEKVMSGARKGAGLTTEYEENLREIAKELTVAPNEIMYCLDPKTGKITGRYTSDDPKHILGMDINDGDWKGALEDKFAVHNHPDVDVPFSAGDLNAMVKADSAGGRVVTPNFIFTLTPDEKGSPIEQGGNRWEWKKEFMEWDFIDEFKNAVRYHARTFDLPLEEMASRRKVELINTYGRKARDVFFLAFESTARLYGWTFVAENNPERKGQ